MRRLVVLLVVLAGLFVAADRVSLHYAEQDVAQRIQADQHLRASPQVSIDGFPFLTQLVAGRYDDVQVTVHGASVGGLRIDTVAARLHGVHVPFGDVVHQRVTRVRVDRATASVTLTYRDLDDYLRPRGITVGPAPGDRVHVTASGTVAGRQVSGGADVRVEVQPRALVLAGPVTVTLSLSGLPFGVRLQAAEAGQTGIIATGTAAGLVVSG